MKKLHTIFLLTFFQFLEGESMVSNQRRTENHKKVSVDAHHLASGSPSQVNANVPGSLGWKVQNPNARFQVRTSEKLRQNEQRLGRGNLNDMANVDKGKAFFRKGRLTSDEDDVPPPQAPEIDAFDSLEVSPVKISLNDNDGSSKNNNSTENGSALSGEAIGGGASGDGASESAATNSTNKPKLSPSKLNNMPMSSEIDDELSNSLCDALIDNEYMPHYHDHENKTSGLNAAYLWVPIRHVIPGFSRGIPLDPPVYASGCFKWKLKNCGGKAIWPLMEPCTYWSPAPLRTEQCGYNTVTEKKYKHVRGRPLDMIPGHCMCDWPCIPYFDPFQRCRVEIPAGTATHDENMKKDFKVSHIHALQLCRVVSQIHQPNSAKRVAWLPIRLVNVLHEKQTPPPCLTWEFKNCDTDADRPECGKWEKVDGNDNCLKNEPAPKATNDKSSPSTRKVDTSLKTDCPGGFPCVKKRKLARHRSSQNNEHEVMSLGRQPGDSDSIGSYSLWSDRASCPCEWPCLPLYDPVNRCVDEDGNLLLEQNGQNYIPSKNVRNMDDQGLIECTRVEEEIYCSMVRHRPQKSKNPNSGPFY